MQSRTRLLGMIALLVCASLATAAPPHTVVEKETEFGTIIGYRDTPLQPWTEGKYRVHDPDRPVPEPVVPGRPSTQQEAGTAPSDAIVLFDGSDLSKWEPAKWKVEEGYVEAGEGSLATRQAFGDCQLHVEWMAPTEPPQRRTSRGNSGVILMGRYEIQIFDSHRSHDEHIYPDGQAAAIYGQTPPLVNACLPPGEWQTFDILFTAPVFEGEKLVRPTRVTMLHNGVLVHLDQQIMGPMAHARLAPYRPHPPKLPLVLQGHGSPVRFRNIWIRPLVE